LETPLVVAAAGVLNNDADPDSLVAPLVRVPAAAQPTNGTLTLNTDGSLTYIPAPKFYGTDGFSYKAKNPGVWTDAAGTVPLSADSSTTAVTITVTKRKK
jgi:hypothetical protein